MSKIHQKYLLSIIYKNNKKSNNYFLKRISNSQSVWIFKRRLKYIVFKYVNKILEFIHQDIEIVLNKEDLCQMIFQQAKKDQQKLWVIKQLNKREKAILQKKKIYNLDGLLKHFKIPIMTPLLWKSSFHIIKGPQLFQIVAKIQNYFLIKYKYFDEIQNFIWTTISNFKKRAFLKTMKDFALQNQGKKDLYITKRYQKFKNEIISSIEFNLKKRKKSQLLGISKIHKNTYYLVSSTKNSIQQSQWFGYGLINPNKIVKNQMLKQIQQSQHDLDKQPFFNRKKIKQVIKRQELDKKIKNKLKSLNSQIICDDILQQIVEQKIQLFIDKYHQIKREIINFYQGVQIFDSSSDYVTISQIRQKIEKFKVSKLQNVKKQHQNVMHSSIKRQVKQQFENESSSQSQSQQIKQEFQSQSDSSSQVSEDQFDENSEVKFQHQQEETYSESQEENDFSEDFFEKIKNQSKIEHTQSLYLGNQIQELKIQKHTKSEKNKSKFEQKKQKLQRKKIENSLTIKNENFVKEDLSTSLEQSKQTIDQNKTQKVEIQAKIQQIEKFKSESDRQKCLYLLKYDDGRVIYGSYSQIIVMQGINNTLKEMLQDETFKIWKNESN